MEPKIIVHPSLTITENNEENRLGLELLARLKEKFSFSEEQLCSDQFYLEDMGMTYHYNISKRYEWIVRARSGSLMRNILELPDNDMALLVWGSGEVHFVSQYFSLKKAPYKKVVFDRHEDDYGLKDQHLMAGIIPPRAGRWLDDEKKSNPNQRGHCIVRKSTGCSYTGQDVHVSIDLDVVSGFPAKFNWQYDERKKGKLVDQHGMSLESLLESLDRILKRNRLRRFDIGGLHTPSPAALKYYTKEIQNPFEQESFEFAMRCYKEILDLVYQHVKS